MRSVKPGRTLDDETIVDSGVSPGETVVTDGQLQLVPGAHVSIKEQASGAAKPQPPRAEAGA
jgi:multidrug efflux system membrane fusion protein